MNQPPGDSVGAVPRSLNPRTVRIVRIVVFTTCVVTVVILFSVLVGRAANKPSSPASYGPVNLPARPALADFAPLDRGDLVPANVLQALYVPADATVVGRTNKDGGAGTFDRSVTYTSPASPSAIGKFFPAELADQQWRIDERSDPVLAMHAGSDGNYWEVGVTISPIAANAPTDPGGSRFVVELLLYQGGD